MRRLLLSLILLLSLAPAAQRRRALPPGTTWTEEYFTTEDGVHAARRRPAPEAAGDAKTPVILTVSPYTNHAAQTAGLDPDARPGPATASTTSSRRATCSSTATRT